MSDARPLGAQRSSSSCSGRAAACLKSNGSGKSSGIGFGRGVALSGVGAEGVQMARATRRNRDLADLDGVAEAVAYGQHDREQLRVADEYLVELAQRLRRSRLLGRANLARHLPAPEEVVHDDHAAHTQHRQGEVEILAVLLLQNVEEEHVERLAWQTRENFEREAALYPQTLPQTRSADELFAARNHLLARLDGDDLAPLTHPPREMYDRVADSHAYL